MLSKVVSKAEKKAEKKKKVKEAQYTYYIDSIDDMLRVFEGLFQDQTHFVNQSVIDLKTSGDVSKYIRESLRKEDVKEGIRKLTHVHIKKDVYILEHVALNTMCFHGFRYHNSSTLITTFEIWIEPTCSNCEDVNVRKCVYVVPARKTFAEILRRRTTTGSIHPTAAKAMFLVFKVMRPSRNLVSVQRFIETILQ